MKNALTTTDLPAEEGTKAATREAFSDLYEACRPLIGFCVNKYRTRPDFDDLEQEAFIALANAAMEYDPEAGTSFIGYAITRIKWHIYRYFNSQNPVRLPSNLTEDLNRYRKLKQADNLTDIQICASMNIDRKRLTEIRKAEEARKSVSIYSPVGEDITLADTIPAKADSISEAEEELTREYVRQEIEKALDSLEPDRAEILRLNYFHDMTMPEISEEKGIPYRAVANAKQKAFRDLRRMRELQEVFWQTYGKSIIYHDGLHHFLATLGSRVEEEAIRNCDKGNH